LKQKIAIVGAGITGLSAAFLLQDAHDVTLFEKEPRLGGHARTLHIEKTPIDTGFIVYNDVNYPNLRGLFRHLGVDIDKTDMSFGVKYKDELDYSPSSLRGLFLSPKNLLKPAYWGMLLGILKFFRHAKSVLTRDDNPSLQEFLDELKLSDWCINRFVLPMGAAIWSVPLSQMKAFPAKTFVRFFENHGLLAPSGQHQWFTVRGGSISYIEKLRAKLHCTIIMEGVTKVETIGDMYKIGDHDFDQVIFATHADTTLSLFRANDAEKRVLDAFSFQDNQVVLHSDNSFMPRDKNAWASWIYAQEAESEGLSVTYHMNLLQNLPPNPEYFITLNPKRAIDPKTIHDVNHFSHPVFDEAAIEAQGMLHDIQGKRGLYFCGAWTRYGFHEDGILSAVKVARLFGVTPPWG
jgi:uncharacterized protein